jgi:hypothetical protein
MFSNLCIDGSNQATNFETIGSNPVVSDHIFKNRRLLKVLALVSTRQAVAAWGAHIKLKRICTNEFYQKKCLQTGQVDSIGVQEAANFSLNQSTSDSHCFPMFYFFT